MATTSKHARIDFVQFSLKDLEEIARNVAHMRLVGNLYVGSIGEQSVRWVEGFGIEVLTHHTPASLEQRGELAVRNAGPVAHAINTGTHTAAANFETKVEVYKKETGRDAGHAADGVYDVATKAMDAAFGALLEHDTIWVYLRKNEP